MSKYKDIFGNDVSDGTIIQEPMKYVPRSQNTDPIQELLNIGKQLSISWPGGELVEQQIINWVQKNIQEVWAQTFVDRQTKTMWNADYKKCIEEKTLAQMINFLVEKSELISINSDNGTIYRKRISIVLPKV